MNAGGRTSTGVVWAPFADAVAVEKDDGSKFPLMRAGYGYWENHELPLKEGDLYLINIDNQKKMPDPASLLQPGGVHSHSMVISTDAFVWNDKQWKGISDDELIIYELHTGTFSPDGNFRGIIQKLAYLKDIGINAIELMPVAQFPGNRNWGYDGVFPYAVQNSYGGPNDLQKLVDACHNSGLAVILDVVYNHLGPEGNYLENFGPYFTDKYKTPWGKAVNFDDAWCDGVRHFFLENALFWLQDYHIDGLRLDAVHAIKDAGATHFLAGLKQKVNELNKKTGRHHFLIAEVDLNDVRYINPFEKGGYNMDLQWCDEFHHALHALVTGEEDGYYSDFGGIGPLVKSFNNAYVYDGIYSPHRRKTFGSKTNGQPGHKFVVFAQNHDQTGNRIMGERLSSMVNFEMQKLIAAAYLLSPFTPMLFMGEEYGEQNPFLYFTSHSDPRLIKNIHEGRKEEFKDFMGEQKPHDPQAEETFRKSELTPEHLWSSQQGRLLSWYKKMLRLRKNSSLWKGDFRSHFKADMLNDQTILIMGKNHSNEIKLVLNFGTNSFEYKSGKGYNIAECSACKEWLGPVSGKAELLKKNKVLIPAESIVILKR